MPPHVLILGGAGFLGSHLAQGFAQQGWRVTVIDGLLPNTGGQAGHVAGLAGVELIDRPIAEVADLSSRLDQAQLVIDAMAWTAHLLALENPRYDLQLNADSHLVLLQALRASSLRRVIYLASRGQYGSTAIDPLREDSPMEPNDIQGIHKLAAESYFRVMAGRAKLDVLSLRIPNCFGERQPTKGSDLGLIGSFIHDALQGKTIEVFGNSRGRSVLYAGDLTDIVLRAARLDSWKGFTPLNVPGHYVTIADLARIIVRLAGRGQAVTKEMPAEIKSIDAGSARMDPTKLEQFLGTVSYAPLETTLERTISWVRQHSS
ncbi:MAG: NAD-dependent epimerase/dehydratase family protein [Verrucomicrobia bacterium]|nr:NAD-dependent epimerase/dehydratase family protein [Verrucomicrobiota bacterium]